MFSDCCPRNVLCFESSGGSDATLFAMPRGGLAKSDDQVHVTDMLWIVRAMHYQALRRGAVRSDPTNEPSPNSVQVPSRTGFLDAPEESGRISVLTCFSLCDYDDDDDDDDDSGGGGIA